MGALRPLLLASFCFIGVLTQFSTRQLFKRNFQLYSISQTSLLEICHLTNTERFKNLLNPIMTPRIVGTPGHKRVAMYLKQVLQDAGFEVEWDRFSDRTPYGVKTFRNLIATFDSTAPKRLVLSCHYDSKIMKEGEFIGATDSAVPCAMLLDLALSLSRYLKLQTNPQVTLQLIFFDGEEAFVNWTSTDSIYGSRHLADLWSNKWYPESFGSSFDILKEIDRIDVLVLLDLLGASNPKIRNVFGHKANDLFSTLPITEMKLMKLGCLHNLPTIFDGELTYAQVEDDHMPFISRGVPVLHLIPVPFPTVWHKLDDNASALHYPTIDNIVTVLRVFVAQYLGLVP
uniref:Glutaminyl-peptide cyclotransferase n=1 Tax=Syphacia muris TaxID=451379 RepID=A0A0N5AIH1_9BILA